MNWIGIMIAGHFIVNRAKGEPNSGIVVRFRNYPDNIKSSEELLDIIRDAIFKDGRRYEDIAKDVGVTGVTIGNLARGDTKWPRATTLFPLVKMLDLKIRLGQDD